MKLKIGLIVITIMLAGAIFAAYRIPSLTNVEQAGLLVVNVSIGPACPVERLDAPCKPTKEMFDSVSISVKNKAGFAVEQGSPNGKGTFIVRLREGNYTIEAKSPLGIGGTNISEPATILPNATTTVSIDIDTGIR